MKRFIIWLLISLCTITGCMGKTTTESTRESGRTDVLRPDSLAQNAQNTDETTTQTLECKYYDPILFQKNLTHAKDYSLTQPPLAAISPHYANAMMFTVSILQEAAALKANYETVIVLAPNHSGEGNPIQCANLPWKTPFGICSTDADLAQTFCLDPHISAVIDNAHLAADHAASTLIPYIHYFFPNAKVVPFLLGRGTNLAVLDGLANRLADLCQKQNILILGSIDFSHYLTYEEARRRDQETIQAVTAQDYAAISKMDPGFLDSPETLVTLLSISQYLPNTTFTLVDSMIQRGAPPKEAEGYSYLLYLLQHRQLQ